MNNRTRFKTVADVGVGLMVVRAALPLILTWLANLGARKIPGYRATVRRVSLEVMTPRLVATGFSLIKATGEHSLMIDSVVLGGRWRDLFRSALIADVKIVAPRLRLDFKRPQHGSVDGEGAKPDRYLEAEGQPTWQSKVMSVPAFRIATVALTEGEIYLSGIRGQNGTDIRVDRLDLSLDNITNSLALAPTLMTKVTGSARIMWTGNLNLRVEAYPFAEQPTFNLDVQAENVDLTEVRDIIESNIEIDVRRGIVDLYVEAAAAKGHVQGYVKPIFDHLEIEPPCLALLSRK